MKNVSKSASWPERNKIETREILYNMPVGSFAFGSGCHVVHLDGRNGYVDLVDAFSDRYYVRDLKTEKVIGPYETIDDLIDAGWKVSC